MNRWKEKNLALSTTYQKTHFFKFQYAVINDVKLEYKRNARRNTSSEVFCLLIFLYIYQDAKKGKNANASSPYFFVFNTVIVVILTWYNKNRIDAMISVVFSLTGGARIELL